MQRASLDEDLYGLLGVDAAATTDEITRAFRRLAMTWHPDRNVSAEAEERFKRIGRAYEILRDRDRRTRYDRRVRDDAVDDDASQPPSTDTAEHATARAPDLRRHVRIALAQQVHGCRLSLKVTRTAYCDACAGTGRSAAPPVRCRACRGSGHRVQPSLKLFAFFGVETIACDDCGGHGVVPAPCDACAGSGVGARKTGRLRFDVPAGIRPGSAVRVRGHGRHGKGGRAAGDLVVRIDLAPHPLLRPHFPDLRCDMPISAFRALAGGTIAVPTLDHPHQMELPRDAANGVELRLAGQGLLDGANGRRGALVVRLHVVRPHALTAKQRSLLEELDRLAANEPALAGWSRRLREARGS
jgi:molecular chaperone DnaJ